MYIHPQSKFFVFTLITTLFCVTAYTTPPATTQEAVAFVKDNNISFINLTFSSLTGSSHTYTISAQQAASAFKDGIVFDGSSIAGYSTITKSDLICKPDISTLQMLPWHYHGNNIARVICDVAQSDGSAYHGCPRTLLRNAAQELKESFGCSFIVSPEIEFFLFPHAAINNETKEIDHAFLDKNGYCARAITDKTFVLKQEILSALDQLNMKPEKFHHEVAPGQHEITLKCCNALQMADQLLTAKDVIAYLADQHGYTAVFMPKPLNQENGSGMHINFSLAQISSGENIFADSSKEYSLSDIARQFIAGVLATAQESTALLNASVNSYKRLVRGFEAPIFIAWGKHNRTALVRIPQPLNQASVRAELRSGDLTANPYLAFAVLLKSGLAGMNDRMDLPAETKKNLYHLSTDELSSLGIRELPSSLEQALALMKKSSFLKDALGSTIFNAFLDEKQAEVAAYNTAVTDWERQHYLNA